MRGLLSRIFSRREKVDSEEPESLIEEVGTDPPILVQDGEIAIIFDPKTRRNRCQFRERM